MPTPFKIVDLFAGPGGLDLAARQLGIPAVGIEWDNGACQTRRANGLATVEGDVRLFGPGHELVGEANVLAGGPPCQTFTVAGSGTGRRALELVQSFAKRFEARDSLASIRADLASLEDERTGLVLEPLRWALEAIDKGDPYQAIVLEQVPAVLPVWVEFAEILRREGYSVAEPKVLCTEEFGVPQTRRRAILIARWTGANRILPGEPTLPEGTHPRYRKGRENGCVPMGRVLTGRQQPFVVISNYGTGGDPRARGRRTSDQPSATVTGKISRNRIETTSGVKLQRFTNAEAGQLQTFPPAGEWEWSGVGVAQQIGNAVPPRFGMHVLAAALNIDIRELASAIDECYHY